MNHPMETGLRKDAKTGAMVPAHHITNVTATVDGKTVLEASGAAAFPRTLLAFKVKGAAKGGKVVVNWVDNTGDKNTAEATIADRRSCSLNGPAVCRPVCFMLSG